MTYAVTRLNEVADAVDARLAQDTEHALFERAMWDLFWSHIQTIDGEWGCCHDKADVLAGECSSYNDDKMYLVDGWHAFVKLADL